MSQELRLCLFDEDRASAESVLPAFEQIDGVTVVDVFSTWETLHAALVRGQIDIAVVNLDGAASLGVVERIGKHSDEVPVLGISRNTDANFIIQAMRAGCAQFACAPVDIDDLKTALQRIKPVRHRAAHTSRRICVVGSSGGAGATTISCNLAMELAHLTSRRTALVDMNLEFGDVCCAFDCVPKYSIADICNDQTELDEDTLAAALYELPCNIAVLGRPEQIEDARQVTPESVEQMLKMLSDLFAHVIVDMPRGYSFLATVAGSRAETVLIVSQLAVPCIRNATRIYESLVQMGVDEEKIQIVLNRHAADFERITIKDVEEHFRRPVFGVVPNDYQFVSAALDLGHPIGADAPASRARSAIQEVAQKLAPESVKETTKSGSPSFLGKFLGRKSR